MTETKTCPVCNTAFSRPKGYSRSTWGRITCCSRRCSGLHRRPRAPFCIRCSNPMSGDNLYTDKNGLRPRCRYCALARGREDYVAPPRGKRMEAKRPKPPEPVSTPPWRPAGFRPTPDVGGAS